MKYVIIGSLGNISKPLTQKLIKEKHEVIVISSSANRAREIESLGAKAAIGSIEDVSFLTKTFKGADAVYTMIPPKLDVTDWKKYIENAGYQYAQAIKESGVKYVVNLSSVGAHMPTGCGPVSGLFGAEKALDALSEVNVLHLRPGYFYSNFFGQIGMIKGMGIMGSNFGDSTKLVMVDTNDIAIVAADKLSKLNFSGKSIAYIVSDEKSPTEIATLIGAAINKPDLKWVEFTDDQAKGGMLQAGLSEEIARNYVEFGNAQRTGELASDYSKNKQHAIIGATKFETFASQFKLAYN